MSAVASGGPTVDPHKHYKKQIDDLKRKIASPHASEKSITIWKEQLAKLEKNVRDRDRVKAGIAANQEKQAAAIEGIRDFVIKLQKKGVNVKSVQHYLNLNKILNDRDIHVRNLTLDQVVENFKQCIKEHPEAEDGAVDYGPGDAADAGVRSHGASAVASAAASPSPESPIGCLGKFKKCFTRKRRSPSQDSSSRRGGRGKGMGKGRSRNGRKHTTSRKSRKSRS
jgi:hypothetical protein